MTRSGSDQAAWPPSVRRRQDEIDAASPRRFIEHGDGGPIEAHTDHRVAALASSP